MFVCKCHDCKNVFESETKKFVCPECEKYRKPATKAKVENNAPQLSIRRILQLCEIYSRVHHKYIHYGNMVYLIDSSKRGICVCCGKKITSKKKGAICTNCDKLVDFEKECRY